MAVQAPNRWSEKHRVIAQAATTLFLDKGFLGTSMDDIAAEAGVSKQTVYKHFSDKDQLFAEIVLGTVDQVDGLVTMVDPRSRRRRTQGAISASWRDCS